MSDVEGRIREMYEGDRAQEALTLAFESYGGEIMGLLLSMCRSEDHASEAFLVFSADVVAGVGTFSWQSPLRSWMYAVARNAMNRFYRNPHNQAGRHLRLDDMLHLSQEVERVRTATLEYRKTEVKDAVRALRDQLDADDRMLLTLRVDRAMAWQDVARAFLPPDSDPSPQDLSREAAKLRKRFERAKDRLRELAVAAGLIPGPSET